ncbi:hypothetical protein BJY04DRAFT_187227 [Aspergillus karnatakaensis]|uniref:uncharacterized protein n=1 Tax=Aspergillus karnatakaensis TaxID=1810916 RepID=UPI003CCCA00A
MLTSLILHSGVSWQVSFSSTATLPSAKQHPNYQVPSDNSVFCSRHAILKRRLGEICFCAPSHAVAASSCSYHGRFFHKDRLD